MINNYIIKENISLEINERTKKYQEKKSIIEYFDGQQWIKATILDIYSDRKPNVYIIKPLHKPRIKNINIFDDFFNCCSTINYETHDVLKLSSPNIRPLSCYNSNKYVNNSMTNIKL